MCFNINFEDVCTCYTEESSPEFSKDNSDNYHLCSADGNCSISKLLRLLTSDNINSLIAGASKIMDKKKDKIMKKDDNTKKIDQSDYFVEKYNYIKKVADYIIEKLEKSNELPSERTILNVIREYNKKEGLFVEPDDFLINEIKNYINLLFQKKIKAYNHPLFCVSPSNTSLLIEQLKNIDTAFDLAKYQSIIELVRKKACSYTDLTSLPELIPLVHYGKYMLPSVVIALFGIKLPVLFDLIAKQDLYVLCKEMETTKYENYKNTLLLLFRMSDKEPFQCPKGHIGSNTNTVYGEICRIVLSMILKKILLGIMQGILYADEIPYIKNLLDGNGSDEELLKFILKIWSFKPTTIQTYTPNGFMTERVYYVEYDFRDRFYDQNHKFNDRILSYPYYDPQSNKLLCSLAYADMTNMAPIGMMNPMYYANTRIGKNTIVDTMGIIILYVPRLIKRGKIFNEYSDKLITTYIDIEPNLTINGINYFLKSAVCYPIDDVSNICGYRDTLSTFALLNTQKGWLKYDPDYNLYSEKENDLISKLYKAEYRRIYPDTNNDEFEDNFKEWVKDYKNINDITALYKTGMINIGSLIIDTEEAMRLINSGGILMIYAQDYMDFNTQNSLGRCYPC